MGTGTISFLMKKCLRQYDPGADIGADPDVKNHIGPASVRHWAEGTPVRRRRRGLRPSHLHGRLDEGADERPAASAPLRRKRQAEFRQPSLTPCPSTSIPPRARRPRSRPSRQPGGSAGSRRRSPTVPDASGNRDGTSTAQIAAVMLFPSQEVPNHLVGLGSFAQPRPEGTSTCPDPPPAAVAGCAAGLE